MSADIDRRLADLFTELRHRLRVLAAADVACNEAQAYLVRNGLWSAPGDAEGLKRALERWEATKASRSADTEGGHG